MYMTDSQEMVMSLLLFGIGQWVLGFVAVLVVGFTGRNEDLDPVLNKS